MDVAHVAIYDTLADWEAGHLLAELRTGRFTGRPMQVRTVSADGHPVTSMGGLRIAADDTLADLDRSPGRLLILPGAELWDSGGGQDFTDVAARFLQDGRTVAAICGATFGLAQAGLLDDRPHTSGALEYLQGAAGYTGSAHYVDTRAVAADGLVTAGPDAPAHFATATLEHLGLLPRHVARAYEGLFWAGDPTHMPTLIAAQQ